MALRISPRWIQSFCNVSLSVEEMANALSQSGFETEIIEDVLIDEKIVIGKVLSVKKHPSADKLNVCEVDIGTEVVSIVCGCPTVLQASLVIVAQVGSRLPGVEIKKVSLRGVDSEGMICSLSEVGLAEEAKGIYHIDEEASIGQSLVEWLDHDHQLLEIDVTPNRGDVLSVYGIARDLSASVKHALKAFPKGKALDKLPTKTLFKVSSKDVLSYAASELSIDAKKKTPLYMLNRLRQAGMGSNHPVVDVLNYVMLEVGQPMHAFNQDILRLPLLVKDKIEDKVLLLDGNIYETKPWDILVCDQAQPHALAGIMGGHDSRMQPDTIHVQLESAMFAPFRIAKSLRRCKLQSDASYRYERGVACDLNEKALAYAILLLEKHLQAEVISWQSYQTLPKPIEVSLTKDQLEQCLGIEVSETVIKGSLERLGFLVESKGDVFSVTVPYYRHDVSIAEDLIEEVARLYGYNNIPLTPMQGVLTPKINAYDVHHSTKLLMKHLGFREVIQFSFVSKALIESIDVGVEAMEVDNPIHAEYSFMRTHLWQSLLLAAQYNYQRQHQNMKLFEMGSVFHKSKQTISEPLKMAALMMGSVSTDYVTERELSYYDMQKTVLSILSNYRIHEVSFKRSSIHALHPNQSADVFFKGKQIASVGMLHPKLAVELGLPKVGLLDISIDALPTSQRQSIVKPSKYPAIYRDITLAVSKDRLLQDLTDKLQDVEHMLSYQLIGVYPVDDKIDNMTLRFKFQSSKETLSDKEIEKAMQKIKQLLK